MIATLLFGFAASAQDETPSETTATDEAVESPTDDAGEAQESSTETDKPRGQELEDFASETEESFDFDPMLGDDIEEILIQGEAGTSMLKDETVSVLSFDMNLLSLEGIKDIRDLSNFTPSLEIKSAFAASNPTIYIRGVGLDDFNANAASTVAIYQDGIYMQSPAGQLFQFFDVDGVEVLRGPQPTLYRNAEAGAILVNSRKPSEEFEGYLETTYGRYNAIEVEGAVGGPIVPEVVLGRVSWNWGIRDGITDNRCAKLTETCVLSQPGQDGSVKYQKGMDQYTNNIDAWAARGQLLLRLPLGETESEWLMNIHGGQNKSRAFQYQHRGARFGPGPNETPIEIGGRDQNGYQDTDGNYFAGDYNIDGPEDIDLFGANLAGSWQFGDGYELESRTGYEWHDLYRLENTDAGPKFILESEYEDTSWQFSQQFDLHGEWGSLLPSEIGDGEWTLGAYYLQEDLDVGNFFDVAGRTAQHLTQLYTQKTNNFAAYAQSEYRFQFGCSLIPCNFTLLGGVRYNLEHKDFKTSVCEQGSELCDRPTLEGEDSDTWTGVGEEVSLAWNFSEDSSLYLKYSHGWKGGHFNGGATTVFDIITGVDPETVDSYEAGLRSYWFDGRLKIDSTGFYYDYKDLQVFVIEQTDLGYPIPKLVNASSAVIYGAEVDISAQPLPGLDLTYNFAYVESEYADFVITFTEKIRPPKPCRTCPQPPPVFVPRNYDYTGNPLIGSPRLSMTGSIGYELPLPGTLFNRGLGSLTPRFSFSWKDDIYFDACSGRGERCNFPRAFFGQEAFWVVNATLTWRSENEMFEVTGWIHNFLDEHYKTQNFDLTRGLGVILDAYADPRMFGITATLSF